MPYNILPQKRTELKKKYGKDYAIMIGEYPGYTTPEEKAAAKKRIADRQRQERESVKNTKEQTQEKME